MPRYQISHRTTYEYAETVSQSQHHLHLAPRDEAHQSNIRHSLIVEPAPSWRGDRLDYFGNPATFLSIEDDHRQLTINALSEIDVQERPPVDLGASTSWDALAGVDRGTIPVEVREFALSSRQIRPSRRLYDFARPSFGDGTPVLEAAASLMGRIHAEFRFDNSTTDVSTPVHKVLELKSGVCQDFAHLMIAAIRSMGVPACYASGYILTHPAPGKEKLAGTDASHAWVRVWAPETGWVDFDPTNNLVNSSDLVIIASGRDYDDVSPISGVLLGGGRHTVSVAVDMRPVACPPAPTAPGR